MARNINSGSPFEGAIGFSRARRIGDCIAVSGTAPIGEDGKMVAPGDLYGQTKWCLEIGVSAMIAAGGSIEDITRTRIMVRDITDWEQAAKAHGEMFASVRPATTFVEVSRFINEDWLVEIEVDAVVGATDDED